MKRLILASIIVVLLLLIAVPVLVFTPMGGQALGAVGLVKPTPSPTPIPSPIPPTPTPSPTPILTVTGPPPTIQASALYLFDMDTGHILVNINGTKTLPMASTTKIMTALIAIQTGNLDQLITVKQDAYDHVHLNNGSDAGLHVGDTLTLKDLLYGLMLPSGDDAAITIADALGGSPAGFVQRMNLFAYHLRLFQTHYSNPDGLTLDDELQHYTTASDLTRLTEYALTIPLFRQIVQTQQYFLPATTQHGPYTWRNTNKLLSSYAGMIGVKTGFTFAAGYCLVFAAERNGHHLLGVVLHSPSENQRNKDVELLLDWGFALPLLPPT